MMRRMAVAGIWAALALVACQRSPQQQPAGPTVTVAPIEQREIHARRTWVGLLNGYQNADIRAQVTGYLLTQNYQEGSFVKKDDILFTLDARPFQAALEQAQADYAAKVAQAQLAKITLERQAELLRTKVISEQEYDTAYQNSQAAVASAAAAAANVQAAQVNLDYCTIRAPFDGVAGKAQAQIGDLVGPGGTSQVLTQISQLDPIKAVFSITEREYLEAFDSLQSVMSQSPEERKVAISLTLADGSQWPYMGRLDFVNRQVDVGTGSITLEAFFPNPNNQLRPGLFARVTAPVRKIPQALMVPQQAVTELQGRHLVEVVSEEGTVESLPVELGPTDGPDIQVINPKLQPGMKVVVEGIEKVRPGMKVTAAPYTPPSPPAAAGATNSQES